jgi:RimJ/RimL family protein N-acetyltransferase
MFYALLSGLAHSNGFCFASDAYLAKRKKVDARTIRKWLENLEKKGYIKRETKKNGMYWDRKIFIMHSRVNSNNNYERKPTPASNGPTGPHREGVEGHIESEATAASEVPPPPSSKKKDPWANLINHFEEEEVSFLKKRFEERPKELPPVKSLLAWARKVIAQRIDSSDSDKLFHKHREQAIRWEKSGKRHRGDRVSVHKDYVEFVDGPYRTVVNYRISDEEWMQQTGWNEND